MTGIDNLDYMTSTSTSTGSSQITLTFTNAANPDTAQVQVQNKLQLVTSTLPQTVQNSGISVTKSSTGFLMVVGFVSTDGKLSSTDLADYVNATLNDTLKRLDGVGDTQLLGSGYAMRIWLDPDKLAKYALMPGDVATAIEAQNTQISAGQLGAQPARKGQQLTATVTARSRLQTAEQFRNIILTSATDGSLVRLNDVATVELGAESYTMTSAYNGLPAAALAINLATGANAISTAQNVQTALAGLSSAVPVVLLGTFGVLAVFGYSINTLTMFAMVLAIGLLVDDAIVVVENVERVMREEGLEPKAATRKSMGEITGALIGITTVLSAVFLPMAFFGGSVGVIYRQFSVTIVSAMILSVVIALVLTPALCASLLRRPQDHATQKGVFGWFNRHLDGGTRAYRNGANGMIARSARFVLVFVAIAVAMGVLYLRLPNSFLPQEDQGLLITSVQLPVGATQDRTLRVLKQVTDYYLAKEKDAVEGVLATTGFGFSGQGQNVGIAFVRLKAFDQRKSANLSASAVAGRAMMAFSQIKDGQVFALAPPMIPGLGNTNGFDFYLQDVNGAGHDKLIETRNRLLAAAAQDKLVANTRPNGLEDEPQYAVDFDQEKASALGLTLSEINTTLSTAWGSDYVNDFIDRGRVKKVYLQSDAGFRMQPEDLGRWHVRNASGVMVPFSAFASGHWTFGSPRLERYNGSAAVELQGEAAAGVSSGTAMDEIDNLMKQLPTGYAHQWAGLSAQERLSSSQAASLYALSGLVIFLCLAALYESWSIPLAVMLTVPIGVFGALLAALLFGQTNDVYFKVGLLTTIGLSAKNAILIVEFALARQASGMGLVEATLEAARQRLRPILMTSFAFILGVAPLAFASSAGSGAQNSIGIGVMGGMIAATAIGVFFIPLLFVAVRRLFKGKSSGAATQPDADRAAGMA
jgi:multidrug efflux pump